MMTFLKHLAIALPLGLIGVPVVIMSLFETNRELGLVDREDLFLVITSLFIFIAIPCVCYYLIRVKDISKWVLLNWLFGCAGIMELLFLFMLAYS